MQIEGIASIKCFTKLIITNKYGIVSGHTDPNSPISHTYYNMLCIYM